MFEHHTSQDAEHARVIRRAMRREQLLIARRVATEAADPALQQFRHDLDALLPEDMRPFDEYKMLYGSPSLRERAAALAMGEAA